MSNDSDYENGYKFILDNVTAISSFAEGYIIGSNLDCQAQELFSKEVCSCCGSVVEPDEEPEDMNVWHSYGDTVDLNFVTDGDDTIKCFAYPVVGGTPDYDSKYEVEIPLFVRNNEHTRQ